MLECCCRKLKKKSPKYQRTVGYPSTSWASCCLSRSLYLFVERQSVECFCFWQHGWFERIFRRGAAENTTSRTQSQILLSRKLLEREKTLRRIRNQKRKIRNLIRSLRLEAVLLEGIGAEVNALTQAVNAGVVDVDWYRVWRCFS